MADNTRTYSIQYQASYDELKEAFSLLVDKRSKRSRRIVGGLWLAAAIVLVILYAREPIGIHYAFMALVSAVFATLVWGYPDIKASLAARKVAKRKGTYKIKVRSDGYIIPYGQEALSLAKDKKSRAFETDRLFAVRPDFNHSIYLPKRAMDQVRISFVREVLQTYCKSYIDNRKNTETN